MGTDAFRAVIIDKLRGVRTTTAVPFHSMRVIELKPPNYPPDWLVTWVDPGNFLQPYKSIDATHRVQDLLIAEPTGDVYWPSEYQAPQGPVKFRADS